MIDFFEARPHTQIEPPPLPLTPVTDKQIIIDKQGVVAYFADFCKPNADDFFAALLNREIAWRQDTITLYGKTHPLPRKTAWYSAEGKGYTYSGISMQGAPFPKTIMKIARLIRQKAGYRFNSVFLNLYRDGKDKMAWHSDDETADLGRHIDIASVSFGAERDFQLRHKITKEKISIKLQHGSLLLMKHPLQFHWEHQVPARRKLDTARINLTFRNII